jgi:DNA-binding MarR family transcriptional regulator
MKLLEKEIIQPMDAPFAADPAAETESTAQSDPVSAEAVSHLLVEVVPLIMRWIRSEMRDQRAPGMTVPQFRTLTFLNVRPGATLSEVSEHVGIGLPSMSKLVDVLVGRGLVSRESAAHDRRCLVLTSTNEGKTLLQAARNVTAARVAERLKGLSGDDLAVIATAMAALRLTFSSGRESNEP